GQTVVVADLDQRRRRQAAVAYQVFAVAERNYVVGPGVQDQRAGLRRGGLAMFLPGGAEKDEPRAAAVDVHGDRAAPRRADDDVRLVSVELGLGDPDGLAEILVRQLRVRNLMAVSRQVGRL